MIVSYAMIPVIQLRPHQQRGLEAMLKYRIGQLIMPTGAGKTLTMIADAIKEFSNSDPQTIVVVAPRILLSEQLSAEFLEYVTNASVIHIHSGETRHFSTTKPSEIQYWNQIVTSAFNPDAPKHKLIFTTYNSLQRLQQADIHIDTIYFERDKKRSTFSKLTFHCDVSAHLSNHFSAY